MAEIKIDKTAWSAFSAQDQNKAVEFLKKKGILGDGDTIVEAEGIGHAMDLLKDSYDCIDACVPVANAAFVACMQTPDADKDKCFEARAEAFYACIDECQNS